MSTEQHRYCTSLSMSSAYKMHECVSCVVYSVHGSSAARQHTAATTLTFSVAVVGFEFGNLSVKVKQMYKKHTQRNIGGRRHFVFHLVEHCCVRFKGPCVRECIDQPVHADDIRRESHGMLRVIACTAGCDMQRVNRWQQSKLYLRETTRHTCVKNFFHFSLEHRSDDDT